MKPFPLFSATALLVLSLSGLPSSGFAQGTTTGDTGSPGAVGSAPLPATQVPANGIVSKVNPAEVSKLRRLVRDVASNTDNIRAAGNFGAQLWLTANGDFALDWKKPEAPTINPVEIALRGTPFYSVIIFYGEGRTAAGLGNVSYDITVLRPDGSVYNRRDALIGYQNLAPADERELQLGRNYISINIGPDDPAGTYTVTATVHDNVTRVDLPLKSTFVVQ